MLDWLTYMILFFTTHFLQDYEISPIQKSTAPSLETKQIAIFSIVIGNYQFSCENEKKSIEYQTEVIENYQFNCENEKKASIFQTANRN